MWFTRLILGQYTHVYYIHRSTLYYYHFWPLRIGHWFIIKHVTMVKKNNMKCILFSYRKWFVPTMELNFQCNCQDLSFILTRRLTFNSFVWSPGVFATANNLFNTVSVCFKHFNGVIDHQIISMMHSNIYFQCWSTPHALYRNPKAIDAWNSWTHAHTHTLHSLIYENCAQYTFHIHRNIISSYSLEIVLNC